MAVTVGKVNSPNYSYVAGNHVFVHCDITGDSSYPTGGYPLLPSQLGLSEIHHVDFTLESGGTYTASYDYVNQKMKLFSAFNTEVTNATDVHTKTWRTFVVGKGWASV